MQKETTWRDRFISNFCNDHQKPLRFLRSVFYDEQDGAEKILEFIEKEIALAKQGERERIASFNQEITEQIESLKKVLNK